MTKNRYIYRKEPIIGRLTQGSIINGCTAEDFPGEEVYGCIITPRCALCHEGKVTTVHYLPMVSFDRWFEVIAKPVIYKKWKEELASKINGKFKKAKIGDYVMDAFFNYEDMIKICNEKILNQSQRQPVIDLLDAFYDMDKNAFDKYIKKGESSVHDRLKALIKNEIAAYYLVETWDEHNGPSHYVIMLRDVRRLQMKIAEKVKIGVSEQELNPIDLTHNDLFATSNKSHFFWVEAELASPFIEHILESFIHNFSKIGVDDIAGNTEEELIKRINK